MGKPKKRDNRIMVIEGGLETVEMWLAAGEIAFAAQAAHEVSKFALNLADELRFEHGVRAGLNRAEDAAKAKRRKK